MNSADFRVFENVLHQEFGIKSEKLLKATYLERFFDSLREQMGELFEQFRFLIINKNSRFSLIEQPIRGKDVMLLSNEALAQKISPMLKGTVKVDS